LQGVNVPVVAVHVLYLEQRHSFAQPVFAVPR
jgi:hypothetical protein